MSVDHRPDLPPDTIGAPGRGASSADVVAPVGPQVRPDAGPSIAAPPAATTATAAGTTVIIVTHQSADVIGDCLQSLPDALLGAGDWEIVVVDNASTDDTLDEVRRSVVPAHIIEVGRNAGYAAAINAGIAAAAPGTDVLVLNPDVRVAPGAIARLADVLVEDEVGIAVPRIFDADGGIQPSLRRRPTAARAWSDGLLGGRRAGRVGTWSEVVAVGDDYAHPQDVDWATGAVLLIGRRCLDAVGPFDESFFLYSEETDYMLRAGDEGFAVRYEPSATTVHLGGDLETSPRLWSMRTINRLQLQRRRTGRWATAGFLAASLVAEGGRAAGRPTSRAAFVELARRGPGVIARRPPPMQPASPGWICFSAQDWWYHNRAHSDFQLLRRIARDRDVLLVNSIGLRMPMPGRSSKSGRRILRKASSIGRLVRRPDPSTPRFRVVTPIPLPFYGSARSRRFGAWLVRAQVSAAARATGVTRPGTPKPVVMVTIPTAIDAAADLDRSALVVNRSDKHSGFPEADAQTIEDLERRCLQTADLVVYTSKVLEDDERDLAPGVSRLLDHGVDSELFRCVSPDAVPADLRAIPHPRVGFFGALDDYLVDFDLLEELAVALPEANLVLIGDATGSMRRFDPLANVHHLGFRPYESIPSYGSGFDVALMPWLDNEWIRSANPIKLKEYLALGLPVVSTDFPEVHRYADLVRIASDAGTFVDAVARTLVDGGVGTPHGRRSAVAHLTWDRAASALRTDAERVAGFEPDERRF